MKTSEKIRLLLIGKVKGYGSLVFFVLAIICAFTPIYTVARHFLQNDDAFRIATPLSLLLIGFVLSMANKRMAFAVITIVFWIAGAILLDTDSNFLRTAYYALMVLSVLWLAAILWSKDIPSSSLDKTED